MGIAGYSCKFTEGASPTTVAKCRDFSMSSQGKEIDISTRAGAGWKEFMQGLKEYDLSWEQLWLSSDTAYTDLQTAFMGGTVLAWSAVDAATSGKGFSGNMIITKLEQKEPLDGALMVSLTAKGTGALVVV